MRCSHPLRQANNIDSPTDHLPILKAFGFSVLFRWGCCPDTHTDSNSHHDNPQYFHEEDVLFFFNGFVHVFFLYELWSRQRELKRELTRDIICTITITTLISVLGYVMKTSFSFKLSAEQSFNFKRAGRMAAITGLLTHRPLCRISELNSSSFHPFPQPLLRWRKRETKRKFPNRKGAFLRKWNWTSSLAAQHSIDSMPRALGLSVRGNLQNGPHIHVGFSDLAKQALN